MQTTLVILKPDSLSRGLAGQVISRFESAGLSMVGCKMVQLSPELLREHYAHLAGQPFYPSIEEFMLSRPVIVMALQGRGAIARVRELLGPTNPAKAPKGTIRGDFGGASIMHNVVHASDSPAAAEIELARFFDMEEIHSEIPVAMSA